MTTLHEAAQQALEALEGWNNYGKWVWPESALEQAKRNTVEAITALRAALAEPVQEPVAFIHRQGNHWEVSERHLDEDERDRGWTEEPLYTAPPKAEPVQEPSDPSKVICPACCHQFRAIPEDLQAQLAEPVAWMVYTLDGKSVCVTDNPADFSEGHRALPLYTAPPQRKPLTEEEIDCIWATEKVFRNIYEITRAIERAHGIGDDK